MKYLKDLLKELRSDDDVLFVREVKVVKGIEEEIMELECSFEEKVNSIIHETAAWVEKEMGEKEKNQRVRKAIKIQAWRLVKETKRVVARAKRRGERREREKAQRERIRARIAAQKK